VAKRFAGKRLLIKMDVEGFEREVLAGAVETLELSPKPTWMVEILLHDAVIPGGTNTQFTETFELFWKHGYQCAELDDARTPLQATDVERWVSSAAAHCKNFLFTPV
jgi:hypothetical protein